MQSALMISYKNEGREFLDDIKAYPNPCGQEGYITFSWGTSAQGTMRVYIYTPAGGLVRRLEAGLSDNKIVWDYFLEKYGDLAKAFDIMLGRIII